MLKNYLVVALRNLRRHKGYTFINVCGLAVGLAVCLLIGLFVRDELSFDRFHEKGARIYRVVNWRVPTDGGAGEHFAFTPPALGLALQREFPEVQRAVRLFDLNNTLFSRGDRQAIENDFFLADSTFFDVFSVGLLQGDPETALAAPYTLVLSEAMAKKYFGEENPVGQTMLLYDEETFTVTGVFADLPATSHLQVDALGSFSTLVNWVSPPERVASWTWQQIYTYVLLSNEVPASTLASKLETYVRQEIDAQTESRAFRYNFTLQPLFDIHLHSSHLRFDVSRTGGIGYVYAFSAIALFVLLIACFNFTNLATARATLRAKEVGMRKAIGAWRSQLVGQFLGEAVMLAFLALILSLVLVELALPSFNAFTGKSLVFDLAVWAPALLVVGILVGLIAGSYPAFYLSGHRPVEVLRGGGGTGGGGMNRLRKGLVVTQFAISITLVIGTGVVFSQISYVREKNLGFDREQVVVVPMRGEILAHYETVKEELRWSPHVVSVAASYGVPGGINAGDGVRLPGSGTEVGTQMYVVDHDYIGTYGMELAAGRDFSRDFPSDTASAFILNETAARVMGWSAEEAIGQRLEWPKWGQEGVKEGSVIGVVRDFHFRSLHAAVEPLVMHIYPASFVSISVRVRPGGADAVLPLLERLWKERAPEWPFAYSFVDESLDALYENETKLVQLFAVFSILAILIACLGLFGLAASVAEGRRKEVGVRKVLGATVPQIVALLSKDFARLVLIALVLASPVAYYAMSRWLEGFAYRVEMGPGLFLLAGVFALLIALLTVSYQAIRAATADPVKSLRYE